jgi:hypothetical protein
LRPILGAARRGKDEERGGKECDAFHGSSP